MSERLCKSSRNGSCMWWDSGLVVRFTKQKTCQAIIPVGDHNGRLAEFRLRRLLQCCSSYCRYLWNWSRERQHWSSSWLQKDLEPEEESRWFGSGCLAAAGKTLSIERAGSSWLQKDPESEEESQWFGSGCLGAAGKLCLLRERDRIRDNLVDCNRRCKMRSDTTVSLSDLRSTGICRSKMGLINCKLVLDKRLWKQMARWSNGLTTPSSRAKAKQLIKNWWRKKKIIYS